MPIYAITITKQPLGRDAPVWSNVYHVEAGTVEGAHEFAMNHVVAAEVIIHSTGVQFLEVRTSDTVAGTDVFIAEPVDFVGEYPLSGDALPIFLAGRVDYVRGLGRALRKFYHPCLGENDQVAGSWSSTWVELADSTTEDLITDGLDDSIWFVSDHGGSIATGARAYARVTQHQFKRKWARRIAIH